MKRVELVRAVPADAAALAGIHVASRAASMPWLAVVHAPEEVAQYFENEVVTKAEVWIARLGGLPAGFMARHPAGSSLPVPRHLASGHGSPIAGAGAPGCGHS